MPKREIIYLVAIFVIKFDGEFTFNTILNVNISLICWEKLNFGGKLKEVCQVLL